MFRVGPRIGYAVPKRSIIMCYWCEEIIGFARDTMFWSMDRGEYYIHYIDYSPTGLCPHCNLQFVNNGTAKYFPTDSLLGRIVLFFANAPTDLRRVPCSD